MATKQTQRTSNAMYLAGIKLDPSLPALLVYQFETTVRYHG